MPFTPQIRENSLTVLIGTVGGSVMNPGSAVLSSFQLTNLPGHISADYFTAADVGRIITVQGAGPGGSLLISKILTFTDSQTVTLQDNASTAVTAGISNTTIFRPVVGVKQASIKWDESLTNNDTAEFTTEQSGSTTFQPTEGQPVLFLSTDTALGTDTYGAFFGGEIDTVETDNIRTANYNFEAICKCVSYDAILTRRVITGKTYSSTNMHDIAQDIITRGLTAECVGLVSPTGPTPPPLTIDNLSYVNDALTSLMRTVNDLGTTKYFFRMDAWRRLVISVEGGTAAPWSVSDLDASHGNVLVDIKNTRTRDKFGNQVYIVASKALGAPQVETFINVLINKTASNWSSAINYNPGQFALDTVTGFVYVAYRHTFNQVPHLNPQAWVREDTNLRAITTKFVPGTVPVMTVDGVPQKIWLSLTNPQDNATGAIAGVSQSNPALVTYPSHGATNGIFVYINGGTGNWEGLNGAWILTVVDANHFSVPVNSSAFGAVTGSLHAVFDLVPAPYDWGWVDQTNLLFTNPDNNGIPSHASGADPATYHRAVVTYAVASPSQSLRSSTASVNARSAIQGGSGLHEIVINLDTPVSKDDIDAEAQGLADAFSVVPESVEFTTYRSGLRTGMLLHIHLTDVKAFNDYLIESVSMDCSDNFIKWTVKATIGSVLGDWATSLAEVLGDRPPAAGGIGGAAPLPTLTGLAPIAGHPATTVHMTLNGTGFFFGLSAVKTDNSGITVSNIIVVDDSTITCDFVIDSLAAVGATNVTVQIGSNATGAASFSVLSVTDVGIAPNVTAATLTVRYEIHSKLTYFGVSGTITLPNTDPNFVHLQKLHVRIQLAGGADFVDATAQIFQKDFGTTTVAFVGAVQFPQSTTAHTGGGAYPIQIVSENEDGQATDPPFTTTLSVPAAAVASLSATDDTADRWSDATNASHAVLSLSVTCNNYPQWVTIQTNSPQYGIINQGVFEVDAPATIFIGKRNTRTTFFPPTLTANETVVVTAIVGADFDEKTDISTVSGHVNASVVVAGISVYSPSGGDSSLISHTITYNPEGGTHSYVIEIVVHLPLLDRNFFFARYTVQSGHYSTGTTLVPGGANPDGTSLGDWAGPKIDYPVDDHGKDLSLVTDIAAGNVKIRFGPYLIANDGENVLRFREFLATRRDDGTGGTKTQTTIWPGGLDYFDMVLDPTKGALDLGATDPHSLSPRFTVAVDGGTPVLDATDTDIGPNLLLNPTFEFPTIVGWTIVHTIATGTTSDFIGTNPSAARTGVQYYAVRTGTGGQTDVQQNVPVRPNTTYYAATWVLNLGTDGTARIFVGFLKGDGTASSFGGLGDLNAGVTGATSGYQQIKGTFTTPSDCSQIVLVVYITNSTNYWLIDDVFLMQQVSASQTALSLTGPLFADANDNVDIRLDSHFVVATVGGHLTLSQGVIDLAHSVGFDTTQFGGGSGTSLVINALAVNKLVAGDALFAGQATFAYKVGSTEGGKVVINSTGIGIFEKITSPTASVTIQAGGIQITKDTNNIQINSGGITFVTGGFVGLTMSATSIQLVKGGSAITITASSVNIVNGVLSTPTVLIQSGFVTINLDPINFFKFTDTASNVIVQIASGFALRIGFINTPTSFVSIAPTGITIQANNAPSAALSNTGQLRLWNSLGAAPATLTSFGFSQINGAPVFNTNLTFRDSLGGLCTLNGSALRMNFIGGVFQGLI